MSVKISDIVEFAKNNGYDDVNYLGKWNSYEVYEPTFDNDKTNYVGYPLSILVKDNTIRFTTEKECFEILDMQ